MKNIFLLMKYYIDPKEKEPFPKFDYQISALRRLGYNVYYLGIEKGVIYLCNNDIKEKIGKLKFNKIPVISTISIYEELYKAVAKTFSTYKFDIAYIRLMPTMPSYSKALKSIKKSNCKLIIEIPTYPSNKEISTEKRLVRKLYFKFSEKYFNKMARYVDLFTLIGERASSIEGRPAINIENGIFLHDIPLRKPKKNNNEIHLLGLANMARWHGYDRLIEGLKEYKSSGGSQKVFLHLIGPDGDGSLQKWKSLTEKYNLQENILFEGSKYGSSLNSFFDICQIAVGSIGMHRKNFKETSELKVREYMARGIPFILASEDKAINPELKFNLKIAGNDSPVNISEIIDFANRTMCDGELPYKMRDYAEKYMTWESQFEKVFNQLEHNIETFE